jgi:hypothetical protein
VHNVIRSSIHSRGTAASSTQTNFSDQSSRKYITITIYRVPGAFMSKHANTEDSAVLVVLVAAGMCVQGNSFLVAHTTRAQESN